MKSDCDDSIWKKKRSGKKHSEFITVISFIHAVRLNYKKSTPVYSLSSHSTLSWKPIKDLWPLLTVTESKRTLACLKSTHFKSSKSKFSLPCRLRLRLRSTQVPLLAFDRERSITRRRNGSKPRFSACCTGRTQCARLSSWAPSLALSGWLDLILYFNWAPWPCHWPSASTWSMFISCFKVKRSSLIKTMQRILTGNAHVLPCLN